MAWTRIGSTAILAGMRFDRVLRISLCAVVLAGLAVPSGAIAAPDAVVETPLIPETLTQRHAAVKAKLAPEVLTELDGIATKLAPKLVGTTKGARVAQGARDAVGGLNEPSFADMDIEALVQYVLMRCSQEAAADIAALLAAMRAAHDQNEKLREFVKATKAQLDARGGEVPVGSIKPKAPVAIKSAVLEVEYCLAPDVPVPGPLESLTIEQLQALYADLQRRMATAKMASKCTKVQLERVRAMLRALVAALESSGKK